MARHHAEGLHVHDEPVWSALGPALDRLAGGEPVVGRVRLDRVEALRVVTQPLLGALDRRRVEVAGQRLVGPRAGADPERGGHDAAALLGVDAVELAEDPLLLAAWNPDSLVPDADADTVLARLDLDLDATSVRRVLDRVVDQVDQELAQLVGIAGDGSDESAARELDRDVVALCE